MGQGMDAVRKKSTGTPWFTVQIIIGMVVGIIVGLAIRWIPFSEATRIFIVTHILEVGGNIFLNLLKLLVVPIVLVTLCLTASFFHSTVFSSLASLISLRFALILALKFSARTLAFSFPTLIGSNYLIKSPNY
jgi:Na+/H+-dicarboxylate symporter